MACNYQLVISGAKHYWNAICPIISIPIERQLLKEPVKTILGCLAAVCRDTYKEVIIIFCSLQFQLLPNMGFSLEIDAGVKSVVNLPKDHVFLFQSRLSSF